MSGDGLLSLRWNNHRASFLHILSVLRTKDSYSDVTLACEGHFYAVHKFVLSTCSDYFVEMIEKTPCKHPVIVLKDIQKCDLEALLNYMYLGEVNVLQNDLARLIKAAECLRIKGLAVPDEAPSPAPPPTPGGGEGGGGGGSGGGGGGGSGGGAYANYADGRSNKPRRRRYESENDETSSSPIRKRPAMGDTNREKASPERRQSRDSSGAPSREPTDSNTTGDTSAGRKEVNVDLSNVKMEAEELKDEYEPNYVEIEDSSDADTNMGTGGEGNSNTTTQPPRSSSANSRIKVEQTSPRSSSQDFQPQSIEEIVSQALPGASIVTGDGSGGPWDGGGSEGDSYQSFPFSQQQDSGGAMHQGPQHSGVGFGRRRGRPPAYGQSTSDYWDANSTHHLSGAHIHSYQTQRSGSTDSGDVHPDKLVCHVCGYKAKALSLLQKHQRIHTGEKPFPCPYCNYSSAQSSNLKVHMKRQHQKEPQFGEITSGDTLSSQQKPHYQISQHQEHFQQTTRSETSFSSRPIQTSPRPVMSPSSQFQSTSRPAISHSSHFQTSSRGLKSPSGHFQFQQFSPEASPKSLASPHSSVSSPPSVLGAMRGIHNVTSPGLTHQVTSPGINDRLTSPKDSEVSPDATQNIQTQPIQHGEATAGKQVEGKQKSCISQGSLSQGTESQGTVSQAQEIKQTINQKQKGPEYIQL
ncbi:unnamed protein product [Meganyctiphanes norvegica]|uniref:Protein hunchback n=1 Tax=Meganyctiphanes norvegica TaxID=48144 RepID=A0AAV2PVI0_MEGNR